MTQTSPIVSFDSDELILVNRDDHVVGFQTKDACHDGNGALHRAFSVFIFNAGGQILLQQRSASKRLWPMAWTNSCCSHPRRSESVDAAAHRRVREELDITTQLRYLYKFHYHARYGDLGAEHELCSVYIGTVDRQHVHANENEVNECKFIDATQLDSDIKSYPERFTPWMMLEWACLRSDYWPDIMRLCGGRKNENDGGLSTTAYLESNVRVCGQNTNYNGEQTHGRAVQEFDQ